MKYAITALIVIGFLLTGCSQQDGKSSVPPEPLSAQTTSGQVETTAQSETVVVQEQPEPDANYDVRNVRWGMSLKDVISAEGNEPDVQDGDTIAYAGVAVAGFDSSLIYEFGDRGLRTATYHITDQHTNDNLYVQDYESLKDKLSQIYGAPTMDGANWNSDTYKSNPAKHGFAVMLGDVTFLSSWATETTDIGLMLSGDNFKARLIILYMDINRDSPEPDLQGL